MTADTARQHLRKTFDLPADAIVLGMVSQFIERKGHRYLLQAMPKILRQHGRCRLLLFGQGRLQEDIRDLCMQLGIGEQVRFAGFRDDMDQLMPGLDLLVHPALMEGLGVTLLEASACGIPIVAARAGGIPEVVGHDDNGLLVEPGDTPALTTAILSVLDDPAWATQLGERGRQKVLTTFSVAQMAHAYHALYRDILVTQK